MTIYDFYLFDRNGNCLYYAEWNRRKQPGISKDEVSIKGLGKKKVVWLRWPLRLYFFSADYRFYF